MNFKLLREPLRTTTSTYATLHTVKDRQPLFQEYSPISP